MSKSIAASLAAVAMLAAGIATVPMESREAVATAPFWQMHGTAPTAAESDAVARLRLAERLIGEQIAVAMRAQ